MSIDKRIITTKNRVQWLPQHLFPQCKINVKQATRLDTIVEDAIVGRFVHDSEPNAIVLPSRRLRQACCHNKLVAKSVKALMVHEVRKANPSKRIAAAYKIQPEFRDLHWQATKSYNPEPSQLIYLQVDNSPQHPFCKQVPVNIKEMMECRKSLINRAAYLKGKTKSKPIRMRVEIDSIKRGEKVILWAGDFPKNLEARQACSEKLSPAERTAIQVERIVVELTALCDIAASNNDRIPMHYLQADGGRWYAYGGRNLQGCSKLLRMICLRGCTEYDISRCNPTIALHYAQQNNLSHQTIEQYVKDSDTFGVGSSPPTELSASTLKTLMLSFGQGAELKPADSVIKYFWALAWGKPNTEIVASDIKLSSVARTVFDDCKYPSEFPDKYRALFENDFIRSYVQEIQTIGKHMVNNAATDNGVLLNAVGTRKKFRNAEVRKALAFLNQAIESTAMQAMYKSLPTAVVAVHDAVITQEQHDPQLALQKMKLATGIKFQIKSTKYGVS